MHRWLEQFFGFSRKELQGIAVLLILLLLIWLSPTFYSWLRSPEPAVDMNFYEKQISNFLASAKPAKTRFGDDRKQTESFFPDELAGTPEYFYFNPNQLSAAQWKRLGLSDRQIRNIKNYERKGGHFQQKEDLKKMYTMNDDDYARLEPYIHIPAEKAISEYIPAEPMQQAAPVFKPKNTILLVELNATDSLSLQLLPGIGPVYASRIVRYRERLGGFYSIAQLLNVYGMDSARYERLLPYLKLDTSQVRKMNVNQATYEDLRQHPFVSPKQANAIIQYRKQHGRYKQIDDLLKIVVIGKDFLIQAGPYLTCGND